MLTNVNNCISRNCRKFGTSAGREPIPGGLSLARGDALPQEFGGLGLEGHVAQAGGTSETIEEQQHFRIHVPQVQGQRGERGRSGGAREERGRSQEES